MPWGNCPKRPMPAYPLPWCRAGWPVRGGQDHGGEWAEPGKHHHGQRRESAHRQQPFAPDGETHGPSAGHQVLQGEDHMVRRPGPGPDLAPPCPAHPAPGRRGQETKGSAWDLAIPGSRSLVSPPGAGNTAIPRPDTAMRQGHVCPPTLLPALSQMPAVLPPVLPSLPGAWA